jgi:hypothetical protein
MAKPKKKSKAVKAAKVSAKKVAPAIKVAVSKPATSPKPSVFKGTAVAFFVLLVLMVAVDVFALRPVWDSMEVAGVMRAIDPMAVIPFVVLIFIVSWATSWLVLRSEASTSCEALTFGLILGILPVFMDVCDFVFFRVPPIVTAVHTVLYLGAFSVAAWAAWRINN